MATRPRIPYRVEYTKNKHSRAIYRDETIVIRLANQLSQTEEHEHIESLLRQMTKQVMADKHKVAINPFKPLLDGASSLTVRLGTGKLYHFALQPGKRTKTEKTPHGFLITVGPQMKRKALHTYLWEVLSKAEIDRVFDLVDELNDLHFQEDFHTLRLKFASSQWGSCSPDGTIMINTALLFCEPSILKYVIIHELAHLKRADHSPNYWRIVEGAMQGYKRAIKRLKEYRLPGM